MKDICLNILRWNIRALARLTIARFRPGIIGITGSVGKTSAKLAAGTALSDERNVRASQGNLNNDLGLPLAVVGDWREKDLALVSRGQPAQAARARKAFFWCKVILLSVLRLFFLPKSRYPEILILEYGADRPGDLKHLLNIARPNVSAITALGDIPAHVEFFNSPEEVAREKARLIEQLPVGGTAVLNYDDSEVIGLRERTRANVITFGFGKGADVRIVRFEHAMTASRPLGIAFKLEYRGNSVPVRLDGVLGKSHAYAAAAAAAIASVFGVHLVRVAEKLAAHRSAPSRMQVLHGVRDTCIIDDSYNASPMSMHAALDVLCDMPARRKIAVLGDMLEIGKYSMEAHRAMGKLAARSADVLFTVGPRARFIAEAALEAGMARKKVLSFDTADETKLAVQNTLKNGDLVLVKGSHAMEMWKIVKEIGLPTKKDIQEARDE